MAGDRQRRMIGGSFGLEVGGRGATAASPLEAGDLLVANGRSAIHLVVRQVLPRCVWLPSYLCGVVIDAVEAAGAAIRFYEIREDLHPAAACLDEIAAGDLVVTLAYFGFPADTALEREVSRRGAWVLRDACQSLVTAQLADADAVDFAVFSPRKHLGVPDGGVLRVVSERDEALALRSVALAPAPAEWWRRARECCESRRRFDREGGDRSWHALFQRSEVEGPIGAYAMSELTREILQERVDIEVIGERRRRNFLLLAESLSEWALRPSLPADVVPLGFPIRVGNRDALRQSLFAEEIFPPIHWPLDARLDASFGASHRLSREILTLPCDQRCEPRDIERMAALVRREARR